MCEVVGESYFPVSYCVFVWCAFCLVRDLMGWVWSRRRREKRGGARLSDSMCALRVVSRHSRRKDGQSLYVCPSERVLTLCFFYCLYFAFLKDI